MKAKSARNIGSAALALTLTLTSISRAADDSWKSNAAGAWDSAANWTGGNVPGSTTTTDNTDTATFGVALTAARAITVDANRNIGGITFSNTSSFGYTLSGGNLLLSNNGLIQLTGNTGAHTDAVNSPIAIQGDGGGASFVNASTLTGRVLTFGSTVSGTSTAGNTTTLTLAGTQTGANTISGAISNGTAGGALALVKNGPGNWVITNNGNAFTGGTTINAGTLQITNGGSLGSGPVTLAGGALHLINNSNTTFNHNLNVTASSSIAAAKTSGTTGDVTHTMGNLTIGEHTLTITKFFSQNSGRLNVGATTLTGNATFATNTALTLALGAVSGDYSITKGVTGASGTLILTANNTYTGGTKLEVGTLQVGTGGATGNLGTGPVTLASGTTLWISRNNAATFDNPISGAGGLRINGNGSIIELTDASHSGTTALQNGVLITNNNASNIVLGIANSQFNYGLLGLKTDFTGPLGTASGGISWATGTSASGGFAVMEPGTRKVNIGGSETPDTLTLGSGGFYAGTGAGGDSRIAFGDNNGLAQGTVDFLNPINLGTGTRGSRFVVNGAAPIAAILSGAITGAGLSSGTGDAVVKFGNGNLMLAGNNSYTGRTVAGGQGAIVLGSANAFSPNSWFHLDSGNAGTLGGILGLGHGDLSASLGQSAGQIHIATSGGFAAFGANRSLTLNNNAALVWASTPSFVGNNQNLVLGQAGADGKLTLTNDIDLNGAVRTLHVNKGLGATDAELSGSLTGADGGLTKTGSGTLVLSGASTYTGATAISAGTLYLNGSLGSSPLTVAAGATLGGSGSAAGSVTINGTLAPGNSIESIATGSLTFGSTATYLYEFDTALGNGDLTHAAGALNISPGATLALSELATGQLPLGFKLSLISYEGTWNGGLFNLLGSTLEDDSIVEINQNSWLFNYNDPTAGSNFAADQSSGSAFVTMTVIPEPSAWLLTLTSLASLTFRRKR